MGNLQSEFRVKANLIFQKVNFGPRATVYESKLVKKPKKIYIMKLRPSARSHQQQGQQQNQQSYRIVAQST